MLRLSLLGTVDLRAAAGHADSAMLAQPRRTALLAFLALARPRGFQRRDALCARFWPEMEPDRARAALRSAVHFIRQTLGEGVLLGRGQEELGLAPGTLECDVFDFERALEEGRLEDALTLYAGPLMPAFRLGDSGEWDRWLLGERGRLARLATGAATRLAERAEADGDPATELRWRRRAVEMDPDDEVALRALLLALDAAGDRAGAVAAYEEFATRMRAVFDVEPASETVSLLRAIRGRRPAAPSDHSPPQPSPPRSGTAAGPIASATPAGEPPHAAESASAEPTAAASPDAHEPAAGGAPPRHAASNPAPAPPLSGAGLSGGAAPAPAPTQTRRRTWATVGALVLAGMAAVAFSRSSMEGESRSAGYAERRVAVLPFSVLSTPAHGYLREGMTDLISARLDGTGDFTTVDPYALLAFLRALGDTVSSPRTGRTAAQHFGAGRYVLGSIVQAGERIHIQAALYDADGERRGRAEAEEVREDSLFAAVDALVRRLVADELELPKEQTGRTAALTTTSLPALKAYLAGESDFRRGSFQSASEHFTRAVQIDSGFALAYYRLSVALDWAAEDGSEAAAHATRLGARLAPPDRQLLRARLAFQKGSAAEAEALCRRLIAVRPDQLEAWNELGEILHHRAMWQGRSVESARGAWEQVIALDPSNVNARLHLAHIAALQGRFAEMDTLVRDVERLSPGHESLTRLNTLRAFALNDVLGQAKAIRALRAQTPRDSRDDPPWGAVWRTADFLGDPAAGLRISEVMVAPTRPARARLVGHTTRAQLLMALGRWREARREIEAAARIDSGYAARCWAYLVALSPFPLPRAEVARARAELLATRPPQGDGTGDVVDQEMRTFPLARHHYLAGALAVRLGDAAEVDRQLAALAAGGDSAPGAAAFASHLAHQLRARALLARGDAAGALALVERGWPAPVPELFVKGDSYSTVAERFLRAELLERLGRPAEALAWYGSLTEDISRGIVFPVAAHLGQGRILERQGRTREAAAHFARIARLWRAADPEAKAQLRAQ